MGTQKVSVREARQHLRRLLDHVQAGDEVVVLRRGVEVGRLVRPERKTAALPDLSTACRWHDGTGQGMRDGVVCRELGVARRGYIAPVLHAAH